MDAADGAMRRIRGVGLFGVLAILFMVSADPVPPVWPPAYEMTYTLSLGYVGSLQPDGLTYPVHVWWDSKTPKLRISFYNGMDETYILPGVTYQLFPRITTRTCWATNTTVGPTLQHQARQPHGLAEEEPLQSPLPDLAGWLYGGTSQLPGRPATHVWQLTQRFQEKVNTFTFHVGQADGRPVMLYMLGVNLMTGSHFDQYTVAFGAWIPHLPSATAFAAPLLCLQAPALAAGSALPRSALRGAEPQPLSGLAAAGDGQPGQPGSTVEQLQQSERQQADAQTQGQAQAEGVASGDAAGLGADVASTLAAELGRRSGSGRSDMGAVRHSDAGGAALADAAPEQHLRMHEGVAAPGSAAALRLLSTTDDVSSDAAGEPLAALAAQALGVLPGALLAAGAPAAAASQAMGAQPGQAGGPGLAAVSREVEADLAFIAAWNAGQGPLGQAGVSSGADEGLQGRASVTKADNSAAHTAALRSNAAARGRVMTTRGFKLSPNKWLGVPMQQWQAAATGYVRPGAAAGRLGGRPSRNLGTFQRRLRDDELPESVDWRGTGADGPVKDQACCGSCWAFASTGIMTAAWFLATGQSISLSEQQIVDCSWDHDVYGCGGGWMEGALDYIHQAGGAAQESDYAYIAQNGFCRANHTSKAAAFLGYQHVPPNDEGAMMEALATRGPVAISFDAVHPTFKYYSHGVYYREDCGHDEDHLNHAVLLVGYGTDNATGTPYWLLRNSWSLFWGESGYFRMARKGNDCGVTVNGVLAVVDGAGVSMMPGTAAAEAVAAAKRQALRAHRA